MTELSLNQHLDTHANKRSVLGRAFDILDCFAGDEPEQTIAGVCAQTRLPAATVHRMLAHLVAVQPGRTGSEAC